MARIPEAFLRHAEAPHVNDAAVHAALEAGRFVVNSDDSIGRVHGLGDLYRRRAKNLERYTTPHAQQLIADINNFCQAIDGLDEWAQVSLSSVELEHGRCIMVWEALPTRELVGVFEVFDQRKLSADEMIVLWGDEG